MDPSKKWHADRRFQVSDPLGHWPNHMRVSAHLDSTFCSFQTNLWNGAWTSQVPRPTWEVTFKSVRFPNPLHVSQAILYPLRWVCFEMSEPTNGPSKNLHTVYSKNQMLLARQSWTDLPFYKTQTVDWSFLWFVGVVRSKVSPLIKRAGYLVGNTPEWFHRIGFCVAFALCT